MAAPWTDRRNPRTLRCAHCWGFILNERVWIAGSTQAPEEEIVLKIFRKLRTAEPSLRLILVPRHPERFDEVAGLLEKLRLRYLRRGRLQGPVTDRSAVVLCDTMGELSALWGLADIAFVGGSLDGKRGGQNMIEPAGYGAAVVFGPHVWNFRDMSLRLVEAGGAIQVADAVELEQAVQRLLSTPAQRESLGQAGRQFVLSQQGATERTIDLLTGLLERSVPTRSAA